MVVMEVFILCTEIGGVEDSGAKGVFYFWEPLPPQLVCRACPNWAFRVCDLSQNL